MANLSLKAGLFSAVSSAFVIDVHSNLKPNPSEQSAALLRAILLTLNQSAIPSETPTVPPIQEDPPSEIVTVTGLMYASLLISLLAAFIAMLGKQWLNRYLRNAGGSMIERCGDRQRKCDGLKKWPFHLFVESLPVMLQVALLLLVCGLCRHMALINSSVASVLISLTVLGVLFYLGIVIAGTSSYECPFQTPISIALRSLWKKIGPHIVPVLLPITTTGTYLYKCLSQLLVFTKRIRPHITSMFPPIAATGTSLYRGLQHSWENTVLWWQTFHTQVWSPLISHSQGPPLPITRSTPQEPTSWLTTLHNLWEDIECKILHLALHPPQIHLPQIHLPQIHIPQIHIPQIHLPQIHLPQIDLPQATLLPTIPSTSRWLSPTALDTLRKSNAGDVRCVSWILWNITDPEALDAAIRLAATVWWFQDGLNTEPPYDLIISTLEGCFDSTGKIYPGLEDRAYSSAQAILWIHICAVCVSEEFALRFPLPTIHHHATSLSHDLRDLLEIYTGQGTPDIIAWMYHTISPWVTPAHLQWTSNALLHLSWAKQGSPSRPNTVHSYWVWENPNTIPVNAILNRLLASCILLGQPVGKEVLKIQDKSYVISFSPPQPAYMVFQ